MFELEVHGGLGRKGTWTRSGQTLTTPLVLFVPTRTHPAPPYAEALFVSDRTEDPRLQIRVSGSFFGPREARHPDDVPPSKGTPLSMTDLEFPEERPAGDLAIVTAEADLPGHNDFALHRAVLLVRNHLAHGRLRELVERRLANAPWNTAVVRHLDLRGYDLVEPYTPVAGREMLAYASESLHRPEVVRFRRRIVERYAKPPSARVLLL